MTRRQPQTVALVEWTWTGHHPTYYKLFAAALADLGVRVVPVLPCPEELPGLLESTPAAGQALHLDRIASPVSFIGGRRLPLRPRALQHWQQQAFHFHGLKRVLGTWEARQSTKIDMVFFACIYESHFDQFRTACPFFGYEWAGLHLHARAGAAGNAFDPLRSPRLRSVGVLDPGLVGALHQRTAGKKVVVFPDLTDVARPDVEDAENGLAAKILEFARGRKIVSLLGHLKLSKGLEAFTRAAADPRLADVVFVLGGEVDWIGVPKHTRTQLMAAWEQRPNIYAHLQRIEEKAFNAVLAASDVVYAAYVDFPFSSNVLTKAAHFHKPIIVSKGHLMADRVTAFALGRTVPQQDATAVAQAIASILAGSPTTADSTPRYDDYAALHSYGRLKQAFAEILE